MCLEQWTTKPLLWLKFISSVVLDLGITIYRRVSFPSETILWVNSTSS